ncbi:diguanylate cyclase [Microbulbifer sp. SAOS-129_SWC]|uniref:sensor domain-containing diguanylate cyclase n=1 Tax=Microbulbifer sp. SAOS-129_SWC TaxID=3145235 RepID=UPI003216B4B4
MLILLPLSCLAQQSIAVGKQELGGTTTGQAEIWHDKEGRSDLVSAYRAYRHGDFAPLHSAGSTGLQAGAFWSHVILRNTTDSDLTLHIEYVDHQLIRLEAYQRPLTTPQAASAGSTAEVVPQFHLLAKMAMSDSFSARPVPHNRFVVPLTIPAGESSELMIKFSSDELGFVVPAMRIWKPRALRAENNLETYVLGFLFGGFSLMAVFSLLAGVASRTRVYYTYSIYAASKVIAWSTILGYTHQYLLTEHFHWNYISLAGGLSIFCGVWFSRMFLRTAEHIPRFDYLLKFKMVNACFLLTCAALNLTALSIISMTIALLLYPLISIAALVRWRQGNREALLFGLAWSLLVIGLVVQALRDLGLVAHTTVNYYWPPVASFIEMITIMVAMGIKVRRLRQQKEEAEQRYRRQLEHSKAELETQVRARTHELEAAKVLAEREARTDLLTGIHNRRSFFAEAEIRLDLAKRKSLPLCLLMLDIDHFKSINDTHGHAIGDDALCAFSAAIANHIRDIDLFGRIGGEEFALLLNEDRHGAMEMARRLRDEIAAVELTAPNGPLRFTASIGVAYFRCEASVDELLHCADKALYEAKQQGRDRAVEALAW